MRIPETNIFIKNQPKDFYNNLEKNGVLLNFMAARIKNVETRHRNVRKISDTEKKHLEEYIATKKVNWQQVRDIQCHNSSKLLQN